MENKTRWRASRQAKIALVLLVIFALTLVSFAVDFTSDEPVTSEAATVLKFGSTGTQVRTLQTKLKNWGYYTGTVDGVFGSQTQAAVRYFQRVNRLTVDGVVGPKTAAALGMSLGSSGSSSQGGAGGYSSADVNLLARCVYAEARGEPYLGQVAVAAVVLNRVRDGRFPNTIAGVIYQPYAFTSVNDGQINMAPNATAIKAAKDAMNGWDPTNGCLYFYNPAKSTSKWILSRPVHLVIGTHAFCT
ncbi:MAG TPA: spore cortex-lytic enzyme [Clostridia bacterium]|nr:spore cortex-lytic enzyme [Clostridia bacterium]HRU83765.1 spore cortex-lytic enzyme [Eubacteriales bacterium]